MKILMICAYFSPVNVIGAVRVSKLAKYLVRLGHEITVISPGASRYDLTDRSLECIEFNDIHRITIPFSKITKGMTVLYKKDSHKDAKHSVANRGKENPIRAWARSRFSDYRDISWEIRVKKYLKGTNERYDIVYSSYPLLATHMVARYAKRRGIAGKWIADFRDPIARENETGLSLIIRNKTQKSVCRTADAVTVVTNVMKNGFIYDDKQKVSCITNGFDEDDMDFFFNKGGDDCEKRRSMRQLRFSYAGGLYRGERDLRPFFKACRELIDVGDICADDISLTYIGSDFNILWEQARQYRLEETIADGGRVTRRESLCIQRDSDCVIVATYCYVNGAGAMTGKIYEPVMLRKPVLTIVVGMGKHSEAAGFAREIEAKAIYEESINGRDVSPIKQAILQMLEEKRKDGYVRCDTKENVRDKYSYKEIARQWNEVIENLC